MLSSLNTTGTIFLLPFPPTKTKKKNQKEVYVISNHQVHQKQVLILAKISMLTAKVDLRYSLQNILSWALRIMHFQYKEMVILNIGLFLVIYNRFQDLELL